MLGEGLLVRGPQHRFQLRLDLGPQSGQPSRRDVYRLVSAHDELLPDQYYHVRLLRSEAATGRSVPRCAPPAACASEGTPARASPVGQASTS